MRRNILHVSLAVFTFAGGLVAAGYFDAIVTALILAALLFTSIKFFWVHETVRHYLKIAILTMVIWIPFSALALSYWGEMVGTFIPPEPFQIECSFPVNAPAEPLRDARERLSVDCYQITADGSLARRVGHDVLVDVKFSDSLIEFHSRRTVTCR